MQAEIRVETEVAAPSDAVWRWAGDWERQGVWMPLTRVRHVAGPRLGVGTRLVARTGIGRVGFDDPFTVTAVDTADDGPRSYEVLHTGGLVKGVGQFRVEPEADGTRFVWWERLEVPGGWFAPLLWTVGGRLTRLGFGWALRRFARAVQAEPDAAGGQEG